MKKINRAYVAIWIIMVMLVMESSYFIKGNATSSSTTNFQMDGSTLVQYTGTDKTVSVPSTVKTIGESAFEGNTTMEKVVIPDSVEKISYHSFADCTGLKTVEIGDGVTEIGNGAFSNCIQLEDVTIGESLKSVGTGIFAGCTNLEDISIDKDNPYFVVKNGGLYSADYSVLYQVFAGNESKSFVLESATESIQPYAFWGCMNLTSITLNNNLTEIEAYAFSNCKSLTSISIPYSVKEINLKAFEDCVNLSKVSIGSTTSYIHPTAFDGCIKMWIDAEEGSYADQFAKAYEIFQTDQWEYEDTGTDDKEEIEGDNSTWFTETNKTETPVESVNIYNDVDVLSYTSIVGRRAVMFVYSEDLKVFDGSDLSIPNDIEPDANSENTEGNIENDGVEDYLILDNTVTKGFSIPKLKIVDDSIIVDQANYRNTDLTSYTIPNSIKEIGDFAFARSGLTAITIPNGVTDIGYAAFYHCDDLAQITIPSSVTNIEARAFEYTQWLEDWKTHGTDDFLIVGDDILLAYKGNDASVVIPDGVKTIAPEVFKGNQKISELTLPDSLEVIGDQAFSNCISLETIVGGVSAIKIEDRAFFNCPIQTVRINVDVEEIGMGAFASENPNDDASRAIIFFGDDLPNITYTDSATRLSDSTARMPAFGAIPLAIVESTVSNFDNTILDNSANGFNGLISKVVDDHEIKCIATTLTTKELASFIVEQDYYVAGTRFALTNEEELDNLTVVNEQYEFAPNGEILCAVTSSLFPDKELVSATLEGNSGNYILRVLESTTASDDIISAYEAVYPSEILEDVYGFEMQLVEQPSNISIKKLGRQLVQLKIPVPSELDQKTFRFVALDENGQLENISYTLTEENEEIYLLSEISHFSTFGFYVTGDIPEGLDRTLATDIMDESPDTGVEEIWPIILLGGCIFSSLALFYAKNRKKITA